MPPPRRTSRPAVEHRPAAPDPTPDTPIVVLGLSDYGSATLRGAIEGYTAERGQENLPAREAAVLAGILEELPAKKPNGPTPVAKRTPRRPKR